jgi:flotillin
MNSRAAGDAPAEWALFAQSAGFEDVVADPGALLVVGAIAAAMAIIILVAIVKRLLYIAEPNEALVFSGRRHRTDDGQVLGYRIVQGGRRAFRIPILERVDAMDMRLTPTDVVVQNAYSRGNIPLQIHAIANVKINADPRFMRNAIERFLGRSVAEIKIVAQQTLEGALREVLAQLTPEEVNEDRLKFASSLIEAAEDDLNKLGLKLDTLKIQSVSDQTGFLDSLGRPRIARVLRDAENAENEAKREITRAQATSEKRSEVSQAETETAILEKRNELRRIKAELEGEAQSVEREAEAAAKTARAEAEKELQALRSELENQRLQADVVIPAEIHLQAREIAAIGEAAPTAENGAAAVKVLELLSAAWKAMGTHAKEIYVIQHLDQIVEAVVKQLRNVAVGEVHVLDQGDGSGLASYASTFPQMVSAVMRALSESTGVDVPEILARGRGANGVPAAPTPAPTAAPRGVTP